MLIVNLLLGLGITIAVLYGVYRLHRRVSGASPKGDLLNAGIRRSRDERTVELERFIADFRAQQSPALARQHIDSTTDPHLGIDLRQPTRMPALEGPARLIYLLLKTALPDHHIFPNARVGDFVREAPSATLAQKIDFLVCDRAFTPVCAVCIAAKSEPAHASENISTVAPTGERADESTDASPFASTGVPSLLRGIGLRYVALNPRALPKRGEIRERILGN